MTTEELTNKLKECDDIDIFMNENASEFDESAFAKYLSELARCNNINGSKLAIESDINVAYSYSLLRGSSKAPGRDIMLKLAFGLMLSVDQTNRLLTLGGAAPLRSKVRRDSVIIFCLEKKLQLEQANELLLQYNLPPIYQATTPAH